MVLRFSQLMRLCFCLLFLGIQSIYATDHKDDKKPTGGGAVPMVQHTSTLAYQTSFAANRHLVSPESNAEAAIVTEEALLPWSVEPLRPLARCPHLTSGESNANI